METIGLYSQNVRASVGSVTSTQGQRPTFEAVMKQAFPEGIVQPAMIDTPDRARADALLCLDLLLAELRLTRP